MKITENKSKYSRDKQIFIKTVVITASALALLAIGYVGMGFLCGYFS
ncbi:MAG: hypothetical protein KBS52_05240 [Clostridiales bacterium]|nr:hypothetical protein [Candidatus Equinaster intestinalis]